MSVRILHGDCLEVMRGLPEASVDSVVTDPPYHLTSIVKRFGKNGAAPAKSNGATGVFGRASAGFMGKVWDGGDVAFQPETWAEVCRVLKPGGYMASFASTRGYHRMVCAVEDAGFIIHPMIGWIFASGFPKAHRVDAEGWEGWRYGLQAMKPALEPICLAQKPMSEKTGTANVLRHGTGAINVDGCRVATAENLNGGAYSGQLRQRDEYRSTDTVPGAVPLSRLNRGAGEYQQPAGRWPANLAHDGSDEVLEAFARFGSLRGRGNQGPSKGSVAPGYGSGLKPAECGHEFNYDSGGTAARFFPALGFSDDEMRFMYQPKAGKAERLNSKHPTIKPLALMRWLARLITPPGGTLLDPFAGSGTTGEAALLENFNAILIEREAEYLPDIEARIKRAETTSRPSDPAQPELFA